MENFPKQNIDNPSTKGVQSVKFDLFDFTNVDNPKRISLDMSYDINDPTMNMPPDGLKLCICVGDNAASASVTLPLWFLSRAVQELITAHHKQKNAGLVGITKPPIIGMN